MPFELSKSTSFEELVGHYRLNPPDENGNLSPLAATLRVFHNSYCNSDESKWRACSSCHSSCPPAFFNKVRVLSNCAHYVPQDIPGHCFVCRLQHLNVVSRAFHVLIDYFYHVVSRYIVRPLIITQNTIIPLLRSLNHDASDPLTVEEIFACTLDDFKDQRLVYKSDHFLADCVMISSMLYTYPDMMEHMQTLSLLNSKDLHFLYETFVMGGGSLHEFDSIAALAKSMVEKYSVGYYIQMVLSSIWEYFNVKKNKQLMFLVAMDIFVCSRFTNQFFIVTSIVFPNVFGIAAQVSMFVPKKSIYYVATMFKMTLLHEPKVIDNRIVELRNFLFEPRVIDDLPVTEFIKRLQTVIVCTGISENRKARSFDEQKNDEFKYLSNFSPANAYLHASLMREREVKGYQPAQVVEIQDMILEIEAKPYFFDMTFFEEYNAYFNRYH
ncbi:hypothetical protein PCE1_000416 [Barthelona sp. PCE]